MPTITSLCFRAISAVGSRLHVGEHLLERLAAHAVAHDVEEGQHPRLRARDDAVLEVLEVPPARAARVHRRGHAHAQREPVRVDAVVARVGALLAGARVEVRVDVDEPGSDVEARDVDHLEGLGGIDGCGHGGHLAACDGHVAHRAQVVARVDDVAAAQQEVVPGCAGPGSGGCPWDRGPEKGDQAASDLVRAIRRRHRGASSDASAIGRIVMSARRPTGPVAVQRAFRYSPMSSAPGKGVAGNRAREGEVERVAGLALVQGAREAHRSAVDGAGERARDELAAVRALQAVALLPQEDRVPWTCWPRTRCPPATPP